MDLNMTLTNFSYPLFPIMMTRHSFFRFWKKNKTRR